MNCLHCDATMEEKKLKNGVNYKCSKCDCEYFKPIEFNEVEE